MFNRSISTRHDLRKRRLVQEASIILSIKSTNKQWRNEFECNAELHNHFFKSIYEYRRSRSESSIVATCVVLLVKEAVGRAWRKVIGYRASFLTGCFLVLGTQQNLVFGRSESRSAPCSWFHRKTFVSRCAFSLFPSLVGASAVREFSVLSSDGFVAGVAHLPHVHIRRSLVRTRTTRYVLTWRRSWQVRSPLFAVVLAWQSRISGAAEVVEAGVCSRRCTEMRARRKQGCLLSYVTVLCRCTATMTLMLLAGRSLCLRLCRRHTASP